VASDLSKRKRQNSIFNKVAKQQEGAKGLASVRQSHEVKYHLVKMEAGSVSHQRINSEVPADPSYRDIDDFEPEPATR